MRTMYKVALSAAAITIIAASFLAYIKGRVK